MTEDSENPGSSVAAVLLAAGAGSRFGGRRGEKLLADFRGTPLISHSMQMLAASPVGQTFVVVEDAGGKVAELARERGFVVVENPRAYEGQATSVAAGLRSVRQSGVFGGMVVVLGDQPLVGSEAISRLVRAYRDGARVVVATYFGKRRNPVLFSEVVWDELNRSLVGDEGARTFLKSNADLVAEVECGDVGSAADVDTREDLASIGDEKEKRRVI